MLIAALQLMSCADPTESLYPLNEGYWRYYQSETQILDETKIQRVLVGVVGTAAAANTEAVVVRQAPHHDSFVSSTKDGIVRLAKRDRYKNVITWESTPTVILPSDIRQGVSWQMASKLGLVESRTFARQDRLRNRVIPVTLRYSIQSVAETVAVPAGKFTNCVLAVATGTVRVRTDRGNATADVNVKQHDWYAPGVGLVKSDRTEASDSPFLKPGFYKLELLQSGS